MCVLLWKLAPELQHVMFFFQKMVVSISTNTFPKCSMYGIFTYIWPKFMVNVGKYSIHGASGFEFSCNHWTSENLSYMFFVFGEGN